MKRTAKVTEAARLLGQRGGRAGRGAAKRRGDSSYYRALAAKRPGPGTPGGDWAVSYRMGGSTECLDVVGPRERALAHAESFKGAGFGTVDIVRCRPGTFTPDESTRTRIV